MRASGSCQARLGDDWRYPTAADARDDQVLSPPLRPSRASRLAELVGSVGGMAYFGASQLWDNPEHTMPWL